MRDYENFVRELRGMPRDSERFGLIHADLHSGNFFTSGAGQVAVFDFDDATYHWFAYDLAVVFYHLPGGLSEPERQAVMKAILAGYRQVRPLPEGCLEALPRFLLLRDLQMYQAMHKKTVPADRDDSWRAHAATLARRIRRGEAIAALSGP